MFKLQHTLQKYFSNHLLDKVFNVITEEQLLTINGTEWTHKGRTLTEPEIKNLIEQAQLIERLQLWKVMKEELKHHAQDKLVNKSKT